MDMTVNEIREDISSFEDRIRLAEQQLEELPAGRLPFKEHKKREKQRRECQSDIKHYLQLIEYANEGIQLRLAENGGNP